MKILISGCSYTENRPWTNLLFPQKTHIVKNVGRGGFGNTYISNSITANLDYKPDFVFILWSGINRIELRTPNVKIFKDFNRAYHPHSAEIENSIFYRSGGGLDIQSGWLAGYNRIKDTSWPEIQSLGDWFNLPEKIKQECIQEKLHLSAVDGDENLSTFYHQYFLIQYLERDPLYYSELTFQNLVNCFNFLDKLHIPYRFSFIYDIFSKNHNRSFGQAVKEKYYRYIDWNKYINLTPYEYGIKHNFLHDDGFHLVDAGYNQWASEVSAILKQQPDLEYLFN